MNEEWRPIDGFDHYDVSSLGRVRSWRRQARGGLRQEPRIRKLVVDQDGYHRVGLERPDKSQRNVYVHDLVCSAFNGPRPDGLQCRHLDGSKTNNVPSNLEWSTPLVNSRDKQRHGTQPRGTDIHRAVLADDTVRVIRSRPDALLRELAAELGVSVSAVWCVRAGKTWTHVR